jgi:hypothetical protein
MNRIVSKIDTMRTSLSREGRRVCRSRVAISTSRDRQLFQGRSLPRKVNVRFASPTWTYRPYWRAAATGRSFRFRSVTNGCTMPSNQAPRNVDCMRGPPLGSNATRMGRRSSLAISFRASGLAHRENRPCAWLRSDASRHPDHFSNMPKYCEQSRLGLAPSAYKTVVE